MKTPNTFAVLSHSPHREIIQAVDGARGLSAEEVKAALETRFRLKLGLWKVRRALSELELGGVVVRVNNLYLLSDLWVDELLAFLRRTGYQASDPLLLRLLAQRLDETTTQRPF